MESTLSETTALAGGTNDLHAVVLRILVNYATTSLAALDVISMGCWLLLRRVNRMLLAAYRAVRKLFPAYVRGRLGEVMRGSTANRLMTSDYTIMGDFMCDCIWGLRRPRDTPIIILIVARESAQDAYGPLWDEFGVPQPADNANTGTFEFARKRNTAVYVDMICGNTNIKWIGTRVPANYDDLVMAAIESFELPCCRVAYTHTPASASTGTCGRLYAEFAQPTPWAELFDPMLPYNAWMWSPALRTKRQMYAAIARTRAHYAAAGLLDD